MVPGNDKDPARYVVIGHEHSGRRIDNYLMGVCGNVPRSRVYRMVRTGEVRVNGGRVRPDRRLDEGDRVRIPPLRLTKRETLAPQPFPAPILFEDDRLLIVDKPAGLAVHAGSGINHGLIERARASRPDADYLELVHRLDRETSGCLMLAKDPVLLRELHLMLRGRQIAKHYLTLVRGRWTQARVVDKALLRRHDKTAKVDIDPRGKQARTRFDVGEVFALATLMEVELLSGRTHQIRAHAAGEGHPIAGDQRYGERQFNKQLRARGLSRLFLHANAVALPYGRKAERLRISSELPADLTAVLKTFENGD